MKRMNDLSTRKFIRETPESRLQTNVNTPTQVSTELPTPMKGEDVKGGEDSRNSALERNDMSAERKWDGTRVYLVKRGTGVKIFTPSRKIDHSHRFPEIISDGKKLKANSCIVDGEFVWLDRRGDDKFLTMTAGADTIRDKIGTRKFKFMAFDIIEKDGRQLTNLEIEERKQILDYVVPDSLTIIKETEVVQRNKKAFYKKIIKNGGEGVMLKSNHSKYVPGKSKTWLKVKQTITFDVIAKGATPGSGARASSFGALKCFIPINGRMTSIGNCGGGFKNEDLRQVIPLARSGRPFVIEVKMMGYGLSENNQMRQPRFLRLRLDKDPREIRGI